MERARSWTNSSGSYRPSASRAAASIACLLAPRSLETLREMQKCRNGDFIFPDAAPAATAGHRVDRKMRSLGVADATAHGFRSTFRDWVSATARISRAKLPSWHWPTSSAMPPSGPIGAAMRWPSDSRLPMPGRNSARDRRSRAAARRWCRSARNEARLTVDRGVESVAVDLTKTSGANPMVKDEREDTTVAEKPSTVWVRDIEFSHPRKNLWVTTILRILAR